MRALEPSIKNKKELKQSAGEKRENEKKKDIWMI